MPYVDALNWFKVPSNKAVRLLWEQLIEGITANSHVCSNHFVDGRSKMNDHNYRLINVTQHH